MTLEVDIRHQLGAFALDVAFSAGTGLTALFGRSGAGKTSVARIIAGLERPRDGRVAVGGDVLFDRHRGISVPAWRRHIGMVFQEARLFPHLSVAQNLHYGRLVRRQPEVPDDTRRIVAMLGLEGLLDRRPSRLSGGEMQRVAIGRALLSRPRIVIMDEPLASLDDQRKQDVLPYLERLRDEGGVPIIYISHSVPEVARLATTVVLMSEGRVVASGPARQVMSRLDLFPLTGRAEAGAIVEARVTAQDGANSLTVLSSKAGSWRVPRIDVAAGSHVRIRVRARDVMLATAAPDNISALNIFSGIVAEVGRATGPVVDIQVDCGGDILLARITRFSVERLGLEPGTPVFAIVKSIALERRTISAALPASMV
jgi:molybdate transport system ATP-binding protein